LWAIRMSPVQRWTMVLLALTPMSMYLNASASSDALTNAIAMLFVASILQFAYGGDCGCPRRRGTWLLLLAVLLGLIKQGYFPLALLAILIPWQSGEARRLKWVFAIAILVMTAISVATWGIVVQSTYSPMRDNIDPASQLIHVREHLTGFFGTLANTLFGPKYLSRHVEQFLGYLGTLDTPLPTWLLTIHGLAIMLSALRGDCGTTRIHGRQRLYVGTVVLTNYALLAFTIYMTWMRVGDTEIRVQGRYLIPLGFPFCAIFSGLWPLGESRTVRWRTWLTAWLIIEYGVVAAILVHRYFALT
jgi:uncharacterized membrane protein